MLLLDSKRVTVDDPCPYVEGDGLPADRYAELAAAFPTYDDGGRAYAAGFLDDPALPQVWRRFWEEHLTPEFTTRVLRFWGDRLAKRRPQILDLHPGNSFIRGRGSKVLRQDFELNGQFVTRDPAEKKSRKGMAAHLDEARSVVVFLWYFPIPGEGATGGDLFLARATGPIPPGTYRRKIDAYKVVHAVPYTANRCVMLLNGDDAIHGVTPWTGKQPRRNINLTIELPQGAVV